MAKSDQKKNKAQKRPEDPGRRDFIVIATNAMVGLGAVAVAWPLIDQNESGRRYTRACQYRS